MSLARVPILPALVACALTSAPGGRSAAAPSPGEASGGPLLDFMRASVGFSQARIAELDEGRIIVQRLDPTASHEVAVFGAARVAASRERVVARVRNVKRARAGPLVMAIATFSDPPTLADVRDLTLDATDLGALARCGQGRCTSKLAALAPTEFQHFDWSGPDVGRRAEDLVRAGLVRYVTDYLRRGDAALMDYRDVRHPTSLARELGDLVRSSPYLKTYAPDLQAYLLKFPEAPPDGSESFVYWARETFGLKPVLSVYHVIVYTCPDRPNHSVIATKQIYASRYFDTSLELTAVAELGTAPPASYVAYIARSRVDSLRGTFAGFKRGRIERESVEATYKLIERERRALETRP